jgi:MFS family permease
VLAGAGTVVHAVRVDTRREGMDGGAVLARVPDRNIRIVYLTIFLLGMAYGVSIALTSLTLDARHFDKGAIGTLAAWFAGGIVLFSLPMGGLVRRFSARTTLVASLVGYAASVAIFPHLESYAAVAVARFVDGACSVGIWVSSETIVLERARPEHKAFSTSLYAVSMAIGYVLGPLSANRIVMLFPMHVAFAVSGTLALVAALVAAFGLDARLGTVGHGHDATTGEGAPLARAASKGHEHTPPPAHSAAQILRRIKTSCFGTFAYGYFQSSVVLFLPLYLIEQKAVAREDTILVPAFFAAGMLLFSSTAGTLADRHGHLFVMRVLGTVGATMILGFVFLDHFPPMLGAVFVAGATLASISPVSLAFQGVVSAKEEVGRANSIYNVFYAAGMLVGPPLSSVVFSRAGGVAMLYHLAALWGAFVLYTVLHAKDDPRSARVSGGRAAAAEAKARANAEA